MLFLIYQNNKNGINKYGYWKVVTEQAEIVYKRFTNKFNILGVCFWRSIQMMLHLSSLQR
jgi:hypothetical protein